MPALLAAHGIALGEPPRENYYWTDDSLQEALEEAFGAAVEFYSDDYRHLIARVRAGIGGSEVVLYYHGFPDPVMFEPGDVLGQLWVADRLARLHGPHVLLPNYLSEVPIWCGRVMIPSGCWQSGRRARCFWLGRGRQRRARVEDEGDRGRR